MPRRIISSALGVVTLLCIALAWSGAMPPFVNGWPHDDQAGHDHEAIIDDADDARDEMDTDRPGDCDEEECNSQEEREERDDDADEEEHEQESRDAAEEEDNDDGEDDAAMHDAEDESDDEGEREPDDDAKVVDDDRDDEDDAKADDPDDDRDSSRLDAAAQEGTAGTVQPQGGDFGGDTFGGVALGGFGGGAMLPASAMPSKRFVQGMHCIVSWSEKNDTLWGYSDKLGKWTRRKVSRQKSLVPTVGTYVAVFQGDDRLYAYSSSTGRWDELKTTAVPFVHQEKVIVEANDKVYIFADSSGRWTSPNDSLENDDDGTGPGDAPTGRSGGGRRRMSGFGPGGMFGGMNPMQILTGPRDELPPLLSAAGHPLELVDNDGELIAIDPETRSRTPAQELLASLKAQSDGAETQAAGAAAELRKARKRQGDDAPAIRELRDALQKSVGDAFEIRQRAQRLEAEVLRMRLQQVDQRLIDRHRLKQNIIDRRLQELIDGNLQWNEAKGERGASAP